MWFLDVPWERTEQIVPALWNYLFNVGTFWILYSNIIPISLYVPSPPSPLLLVADPSPLENDIKYILLDHHHSHFALYRPLSLPSLFCCLKQHSDPVRKQFYI